MRRALTALLVVAVAALAAFGLAADDADGTKKAYWVELDNAFGLIEGADVKVAGVRAGKVGTMELNQDTLNARVEIEITEAGFGDLRSDVFCETRPQSLIGEYFVDCQPGQAKRLLANGATIPVRQTGSTIPADLIQNIMRRPYRERFSILISELGGAFAGRGRDLNETIRRLSPALREVDRVLAILAEERRTIRDLYGNAEQVMTRVADRREALGRYVEELRDTARAYGNREVELSRQFARLPAFLDELRPTLNLLGQAADEQAPALANLRRSAPLLRDTLNALADFSTEARPAFVALGEAAREGRPAVRAARPNIRQLGKSIETLPETADNLAITLEHLDNPAFAVEKDERAGRPGGGYTGLEAILRYVWAQSQAINVFDANNFLLKVTAFADRDCQNYATDKNVLSLPKRCHAWLGPNQPGVTSPDFTENKAAAARAKAGDDGEKREDDDAGAAQPAAAPGESPAAAAPPSAPAPSPTEALGRSSETVTSLLDYLLGS